MKHHVRFILRFFIVIAVTLPAGIAARSSIKVPRTMGKDYFVVFPNAAYGNNHVGVLINSPVPQRVTVTTPQGSKGLLQFTQPRSTRYYTGQFRIDSIPETVMRREATRITSPSAISVTAQYGTGGISGTYSPLPITAWGTEYYVVDAPEGVNSGYAGYPAIYSVPMATIIGSHAGTSVTITPKTATASGHAPGVPFTVTLNEGDVYNLSTAGDPKATTRAESPCTADLSGTHITSSFPVGVIVSQSHTSWPCGDNNCGDYGVEWLPPVCNLDSVYVLTRDPLYPLGDIPQMFRIVCVENGTDLTIDDGAAPPRNVGTYGAGDIYDLPFDIGSEGLVISGSHPFVVAEFTRSTVACTPGVGDGTINFSINILQGVHDWSSFQAFAAPEGSNAVARIVFRYAQRTQLHLNGKRLIEMFPVMKSLAEGYGTVAPILEAGKYYELRGDSGATVGGTVFGFGTSRYAPGGVEGEHTAGPALIKSFTHPIGAATLPKCNPDITPPHVSATYTCGHWDINAFDDEVTPPATGVYDISSVYDAAPDTSFNTTFNVAYQFPYGVFRVSGIGIDVINLLLPAQATLRVRDGAGNEYDTTFTYLPPTVSVTPTNIDLGAVRVSDSVTATMVLKNRGTTPVVFSNYRMRYGTWHHWTSLTPPTPVVPFTLAPGDSVEFAFRYTSPNTNCIEFDDDTLFVTMCREFPVLHLFAMPAIPGIAVNCRNFGEVAIDTLQYRGDTVTVPNAIWCASVGGDTLRVTGLKLVSAQPSGDHQFPGDCFTIVAATLARSGAPLPVAPSALVPWNIAPGDTALLTIAAHPHESGWLAAWLTFASNANDCVVDSSCLTVVGTISPDGVDEPQRLPQQPILAENYPNPFSEATTINYALRKDEHVAVRVVNMLGETVATLVDARESAGTHAVSWNGSGLRNGVYGVIVNAGGSIVMKILVKVAGR